MTGSARRQAMSSNGSLAWAHGARMWGKEPTPPGWFSPIPKAMDLAGSLVPSKRPGLTSGGTRPAAGLRSWLLCSGRELRRALISREKGVRSCRSARDSLRPERHSWLRPGMRMCRRSCAAAVGLRRVGFRPLGETPRASGCGSARHRSHEALCQRVGHGARPRGLVELREDVGDVAMHGVSAEGQYGGDFVVAHAPGDEPQHLYLAWCEDSG